MKKINKSQILSLVGYCPIQHRMSDLENLEAHYKVVSRFNLVFFQIYETAKNKTVELKEG